MNSSRKKRLFIVLFLLLNVSIAVALILFALGENLNHFYAPSQIAAGAVKTDQKIRIGGLVVEGSVQRKGEGLMVSFELTDNNIDKVEVRYTGILPDLFREGQGIVATGRLNAEGAVIADEVLAKHDENYMPPEALEALKQGGYFDQTP